MGLPSPTPTDSPSIRRLHGQPVVAACDYLDICGGTEFMERMEAAMESGSLVISACGFDSVPAELGLMFNSRQWCRIGQVRSQKGTISFTLNEQNLNLFYPAVA
ncbi:hypothetical protein Acr_27g0010270 [Actinidia rufa]|uniref:Uncharacterized protein n=1 Tax=Actinidia rufa TaxID=165716 RepID=A0A7J0H8D4_9ERIC|nr:hypothetical protein Acr_27g0010270 [Actinidia rufa]